MRLLPASAFEVLKGWRYRVEVPQPPGDSGFEDVQPGGRGTFHLER